MLFRSNTLQNYPTLTGAVVAGGQVQIIGSINSAPGTSFRLEFFASGTVDPSLHGEGERFLGTVDVTTDASGNWNFSPTFTVVVAVGDFVTATATNLTTGDTSEFAASVAATTNTPPVANNANVTGFEDDPSIVIVIDATDAEGPIDTFQLSTLPANGTLFTDPGLTTAAKIGRAHV